MINVRLSLCLWKRAFRSFRRLRAWHVALLILLAPSLVCGQEPADPNKVKAAFLRNFARYVVWPQKAFSDDLAPWRVCVLGSDPFGSMLEATLAGRKEQGRPFAIYRGSTLDALPACQILYVAYNQASQRRSVLSALRDQPVLTVGDGEDFLFEGGMIRFRVGERVEISVNLDRTRAASLLVQTKMLEVSYQALENGILRTLR